MTGNAPLSLIETLQDLPLLQNRQQAELPRLRQQFPKSIDLARELIRLDWLTPYQANQIFRGRGGDLLLDSYVLLERLGEGGVGQVFKARHIRMGRIVAVKIIRRERLRKANAVRRFHREVCAAARLDHPNVVHAYDAGRVGDRHYFVMEHVEGADFDRLIERCGPLSAAEACECIRQAARGLGHAHDKGLIHRDVKPQNLMLTTGSRVKVLDLGLSRNTEPALDAHSQLTRDGAVLGTVDFLAPEQAADPSAADARADLYGLGCTFYFLLTGRVPFPGGSTVDKLLRHQSREPEPLEQVCLGISTEVATVVRKLMAKRPEDRYQSASELLTALEALPALPLSAAPPFLAPRSGGDTLAEASN